MKNKLSATCLLILLMLPGIAFCNKIRLSNKKKNALVWKTAELTGSELVAGTAGKTSIGVRQNEQSWFKGSI